MATETNSPYLFIGVDNNVVYKDARDSKAAAGTYLNSGTCSWSVYTLQGDLVASGGMSFVDGSNGRYEGIIDGSVAMVNRDYYRITAVFKDGEFDDKRSQVKQARFRE